MARTFGNAQSNYFKLVRGGANYKPLLFSRAGQPVSCSILFKPSLLNERQGFLNAAFNSTNPSLLWDMSNAKILRCYSGALDTGTLVPGIVVDEWIHLGFSWSVGGRLRYYAHGRTIGVSNLALGGVDTVGLALGTLDGSYFDVEIAGNLAEFGMWDAELNQAEWASLGRFGCPLGVRRRNLVAYTALTGQGAVEADPCNGGLWTVVGTLTGVAHPPVSHATIWKPYKAGAAAAAGNPWYAYAQQ